MGLDPRLLLQATRSVTVSYPIPFLFVALLVMALLCLIGMAVTAGLPQTAFLVAAALSGLLGAVLVCYAAFVRRDLLRSERHQSVDRYLEWLHVQDVDDRVKVKAAEQPLMALLNQTKGSKSSNALGATGRRDEHDG